MTQVTVMDKSNAAGDKDWREVSKDFIITAYEPYTRPGTMQKQIFTRSSEAWLFNNPDALASVQRGLSDAAQGRVSKIDLDTL